VTRPKRRRALILLPSLALLALAAGALTYVTGHGKESTDDAQVEGHVVSVSARLFGTPIDQIGWVSTGYMMANIVIIPMTGWFQRRFGYRNYFAASIGVFSAASALCGLSWRPRGGRFSVDAHNPRTA
jgi:MFS family permease